MASTEAMQTEEASGSAMAPTKKQKTRQEQVASLPWVEKYRPKDMADLVSHEEIISTVTKLIDAGQLPHLLLYGPPGTGKTSTILACAHRMYGKNFLSMVLELNASDDRGIDVVREQIKEFASTRQMFTSMPKLVLLDEADNMTNAAQFALRRVIEKYTRNARFCLICNYASKIIPALQSRCTRFRFAPLAPEQALDRVRIVAEAEAVNATPDGLDACITLGEGDMRKCLNILQSTHMAFDAVTPDSVYRCTGSPKPDDVQIILTCLLQDDFATATTQVRAPPPPAESVARDGGDGGDGGDGAVHASAARGHPRPPASTLTRPLRAAARLCAPWRVDLYRPPLPAPPPPPRAPSSAPAGSPGRSGTS